ncbi:hypothetical protein P9112_005662 [Eukaryota sp. TZLM1-RC]
MTDMLLDSTPTPFTLHKKPPKCFRMICLLQVFCGILSVVLVFLYADHVDSPSLGLYHTLLLPFSVLLILIQQSQLPKLLSLGYFGDYHKMQRVIKMYISFCCLLQILYFLPASIFSHQSYYESFIKIHGLAFFVLKFLNVLTFNVILFTIHLNTPSKNSLQLHSFNRIFYTLSSFLQSSSCSETESHSLLKFFGFNFHKFESTNAYELYHPNHNELEQRDVRAQQAETESLRKTIAKLNSRVEAMNREKKHMIGEMSTLNQSIRVLEDKISALECDLDLEREINSDSQATISKLREDLMRLKFEQFD